MKNNSDTFDIYKDTISLFHWNRDTFGLRLAKMREALGFSARKMSLDLGQNKNYINSIESGRNFPTMEGFFNICEYLKIEPHLFFSVHLKHPYYYPYFIAALEPLCDAQIKRLYELIIDLGAAADNQNPQQ